MFSTRVFCSPRGTRVDGAASDGDELYLLARGVEVRLWRIPPGHPPHEVALVANPHQHCLVGVEHDGVVCREADDTLVVISRSGERHVLRRLAPSPTAIVTTPEHVVWCGAGAVWRWWRGTDNVDELAKCDDAKLAIRPVPTPYPAGRIASDVAITDGTRLGLIDVDGVEWLSEVDEHELLACASDAIYWAVGSRLHRYLLDLDLVGEARSLRSPVMALAAHDRRVFVANNFATDRPPIATTAKLTVIDFAADTTLQIPLMDAGWKRDAMQLVVAKAGLFVVENGKSHDDVDRVSYVPETWSPFQAAATLQIQRWLADGRGGHLAIARGWWWSGPTTGRVPEAATTAVNEWLREHYVGADAERRVPRHRGWEVSMGNHAWFSAHGDRVTVAARAIQALIEILAPHVPPLARLKKLA